MGNEGVGMVTDVSFTVRREGAVIDERRVIGDVEFDPIAAKFADELLSLINDRIETEGK